MVKPKIVEGKAYELKPGKKYVLVISREAISLNDMSKLANMLNKQGVKSIVVGVRGKVRDAIELVEADDSRIT